MELKRGGERPTTVRRHLFLALASTLLFLTACAPEGEASPEVPVEYQDPQVGAARLMADSTPGIRDVVNVTGTYPDPGHQVVGAAVLIDDRVGEGAAPTDFRHRPVFVVFVSKSAARHAVSGLSASEYLRNGLRVVFLPSGLPDDARRAYEEGLGAALQ